MTSYGVLSLYLTLNALIAVASVYLFLMRGRSSAKHELSFHYRCLILVFAFTAITPFIPKKPIFEPIVRIWTPDSERYISGFETKSKDYVVSFSESHGARTLESEILNQGLVVILTLIGMIGAYLFVRDLARLHKIVRSSFLVRKIGRVSISVHPGVAIPFSAWTLTGAHVVVPQALLASPENFRISILHELQHHRQCDTRWLYVWWLLQGICFWNPFVYRWKKHLSEVQEFACDESLVDRRKVDSHQYARCLIEVAQTALKRGRIPACATGMISPVGRSLTKRRIEIMMNLSVRKQAHTVKAFNLLGMIGIMASTVFASQGWIQDRRISLEEANRLAEHARKGSDFPIVVNDLVLKHLNLYLGSKEGRELIKTSLKNREEFRSMIDSKLKKYQVPEELAAIPIVESRYVNQPETHRTGWGAGLWMFIKSTATRDEYRLTVNEKVDERLNPELETEAAMKLLNNGKKEFGDWLLSILSYNAGEGRVRKAMKVEKTSDPWELTRKHYDNDDEYLPKVMAAIIILKNPEAL